MEYRNARYNQFGTIDCEINHPRLGWLPFTASPDDAVEHGRAIHAAALAGDVAAYVPPADPTPEEARARLPNLTARQIRLGLIANGFTLDQVQTAIDAIPDAAQKAAAQVEWEYATQFERLHPLVASVGSALGLTDEQIDTLWTASVSL
jgi:hypothetical protein